MPMQILARDLEPEPQNRMSSRETRNQKPYTPKERRPRQERIDLLGFLQTDIRQVSSNTLQKPSLITDAPLLYPTLSTSGLARTISRQVAEGRASGWQRKSRSMAHRSHGNHGSRIHPQGGRSEEERGCEL